MSLRLDDMVLKENQLRLTLATMDHRMSRIDEVADNLLHAVSLLTSTGRRGRHGGSQDSLDVSFLVCLNFHYMFWQNYLFPLLRNNQFDKGLYQIK